MSYMNKRDKIKKQKRNNRPKINQKKFFSDKWTLKEHKNEMRKYQDR